MRAMTITYEVGNKLYLNLTNKCPCACLFCIRQNGDGAYGSDSLWLQHEPSFAEVEAALSECDLDSYEEIVFCGYGEPLMRLDFCLEVATLLKRIRPTCRLRINTNGLADLYNPNESTRYGTGAAEKVCRIFDAISISLNAGNPEVYQRVTRVQGAYADRAYDTMLDFAQVCKVCRRDVKFTVVDILSPLEIAQARDRANSMGIPFEVRAYIQ